MTEPKFTKPFDIEHAKAGAPYCCANGNEATVLKWNCRDPSWPLVGVIRATDDSNEWNLYGKNNSGENSEFDLVMLPLGFIDDKPVFVADEIEMNTIAGWTPAFVEPRWGGTWNDNGKLLRWPAPSKAYPLSRMSDDELLAIGLRYKTTYTEDIRETANAALRHAIDAGQVLQPENVQGRDVRDAAIAVAVCNNIRNSWALSGLNACKVYCDSLNLAAIIAQVKS